VRRIRGGGKYAASQRTTTTSSSPLLLLLLPIREHVYHLRYCECIPHIHGGKSAVTTYAELQRKNADRIFRTCFLFFMHGMNSEYRCTGRCHFLRETNSLSLPTTYLYALSSTFFFSTLPLPLPSVIVVFSLLLLLLLFCSACTDIYITVSPFVHYRQQQQQKERKKKE